MNKTKKKFGVKIDGRLAERIDEVKERAEKSGKKRSRCALVTEAASIGLPTLEKELKHGKAI